MDQVKKFLETAAKQSFWIVSGVTLLLGIVGYWVSRSTMNKVFTEQSGKIDSQYSALNTIKSEVSRHPNASSHQEMDKLIQKLVVDVESAWKLQYERQSQIMQWPKDKLPPRLISKVEKLKPIELTLEYPLEPAKDPLVKGDLQSYGRYFNQQFPRLAEIIGTKWVGTAPAVGQGMGMGMGGPGLAGGMPGSEAASDPSMGMGGSETSMSGGMPGMMPGGMPGMMGPNGMMMPKPDLVIWPKAQQDAVIADVQTWRTPDPTTHDVLYTQENIWILEGLLNIIRNVNEKAKAKANFQATVKEIIFLRIGRSAVGKAGNIDRPMMMASPGGGGEGDAMGMENPMGMDASAESAAGPPMGMEASAEGPGAGGVVMTPDPANGRYVDAAYAPLTAEDLRSKMKSESPEDAYFAVAKRVPVRLRLKVDQRRLQTLIAECGNANLLFEIRQIRIGDTVPAAAAGMGGGMSSMLGFGTGSETGAGMPGDGGGASDAMGMGGGMMGSEPGMMGGMPGMGMGAGMNMKTWDVPVEIYGVVYLFNPPDPSKLGLNKVTAETEVKEKVEVNAAEAQAADQNATAAAQAAGQAQPGAAQPGQPAAQPGQPGAQPGAVQPGQPGAVQPGQPAAQPGAVQPGQPGAVQPAQPGCSAGRSSTRCNATRWSSTGRCSASWSTCGCTATGTVSNRSTMTGLLVDHGVDHKLITTWLAN